MPGPPPASLLLVIDIASFSPRSESPLLGMVPRGPDMDKWLKAALDYMPRWLDYQMRDSEQPGCVIAVSHQGRIVLEEALGHADLSTGEKLTPRHRQRVASHSKSFTAAAVMKLVEEGKLRLDDRAGEYVEGLHPAVA